MKRRYPAKGLCSRRRGEVDFTRAAVVAQNAILLYRGWVIRRPPAIQQSAERHSAIQQMINLRYVGAGIGSAIRV